MRLIMLSVVLLAAGNVGADELARGKAVYEQTCIACHGAKGKSSIPGVVNLTQKGGPLMKSDEELFSSIRDGLQRPGATMTMPPKGGNPNLMDQDIGAVLQFLRQEFQP
jgi:mono/diheme cytochrome c family protein